MNNWTNLFVFFNSARAALKENTKLCIYGDRETHIHGGAGQSGNGKNLSLECTVHPLQLENGKQGTKNLTFYHSAVFTSLHTGVTYTYL